MRERERKEYVRALNTSILSSIGHTHTPVDDHFKNNFFDKREREMDLPGGGSTDNIRSSFETRACIILIFWKIFEKFEIWKKSNADAKNENAMIMMMMTMMMMRARCIETNYFTAG